MPGELATKVAGSRVCFVEAATASQASRGEQADRCERRGKGRHTEPLRDLDRRLAEFRGQRGQPYRADEIKEADVAERVRQGLPTWMVWREDGNAGLSAR